MNVSADTLNFAGSSISFDDCNNFAGIDISKNPTVQYTSVKFIDRKTGWAGGFNKSPAEGGIFKWVGHIPGVDFAANGTYIDPNQAICFTNLTDITNAQAYYWQFYGANPANSTDANPCNIVYPSAGSYDVSLTVYTPTKNISYFRKNYVNVSDGIIKNAQNINFSIFPNPVANIIHIKSDYILSNIKIINILGEVVYENAVLNHDNTVDVTSLKNGVYFLKAVKDKETITQKFIIQK